MHHSRSAFASVFGLEICSVLLNKARCMDRVTTLTVLLVLLPGVVSVLYVISKQLYHLCRSMTQKVYDTRGPIEVILDALRLCPSVGLFFAASKPTFLSFYASTCKGTVFPSRHPVLRPIKPSRMSWDGYVVFMAESSA